MLYTDINAKDQSQAWYVSRLIATQNLTISTNVQIWNSFRTSFPLYASFCQALQFLTPSSTREQHLHQVSTYNDIIRPSEYHLCALTADKLYKNNCMWTEILYVRLHIY